MYRYQQSYDLHRKVVNSKILLRNMFVLPPILSSIDLYKSILFFFNTTVLWIYTCMKFYE